MEIKLYLTLDENGKISLKNGERKEYLINDMVIQAQDIFNILDYQIGNTYVLEPLDIDEEKYSKQMKIIKPLFDMLLNLIKQINDLKIDESKTHDIKLNDIDSE